ncbi:type VII secretion protein EccE, partial [Streptomyces sp. NPDC059558]
MATATEQQTGAPAPARGGVTPHPKSSPGRFGPFRLQQLVLLQVAAAALLVAWVVEPLLLVPTGVLALVLVVLAVVRRHQRSLPEWIGGALALRKRPRPAPAIARAPGRA